MVQIQKLGSVCHKWDHHAHHCRTEIDVFNVAGTRAAHFVSKLAVDADGAPQAYHPDDRTPPDNSAQAYDWLTNVSTGDLHGIQGSGGIGPAPGFYVSGTTLHDSRYPENDARHWVDAAKIPYIVLPTAAFPVPAGTTLHVGCVAQVVDLRVGGSSGAIFADAGHAVGEGSIALARRLGLDPFSHRYPPKVVGFEDGHDDRRFLYVVFPEEVIDPPWPVSDIQAHADALFQQWGGVTRVKALYPHAPALRPPVNTS